MSDDEDAGQGVELDDSLDVSVVLDDGADADARLRDLLRPVISTPFVVRPAFQAALRKQTGDRFWIVMLPDVDRRSSSAAFELARAIARLPGVSSARPALVDSLVGEAMVRPGRETESIFGGCNSKDAGPAERGWAPRGLGALEAWKKSKGAGVTVASIDTGSSQHTQLAGVWSARPRLNLVEGGADASDRFSQDVMLPNPGHGTLVASVVASRGVIYPDGTTGSEDAVTGMAPEADILPIRAIRSVVDVKQSRIPAAIEHAIAQDCDVIIMALGSAFPIEPVEVALRAAVEAGMVVVCAAGNCVGPVVFPARFAPQGLACAVAAVDFEYRPWEKTSRGDAVTVSAFGEAVWGARLRSADGDLDEVAPSQGTTLASSLTAGAAALWLGAQGGRAKLKLAADKAGVTVQRLFNEAISATAFRPAGWGKGLGAGLVNAGALVRRPLPTAEETLNRVPLPVTHFTPLAKYLFLAAQEADIVAGLEAAGVPEPVAAEALWRMALASAERRVAAAEGRDNAEAPPSAGTAELAAALDGRPGLRALTY
jgi:hypothetical protein